MTRLLDLHIAGRLPGLNSIVTAARGNRYAAAKQKRDHTQGVELAARGRPRIAGGWWLFVWSEPNRRRDPDNVAAGGCKVIFDGLIAAGVLDNDGWQQVRGILHAYRVGKPGVTVQCYEQPGSVVAAWLRAQT